MCVCIYIYICISLSLYIYIYIYMYVCVYIYIYIHTHTYTDSEASLVSSLGCQIILWQSLHRSGCESHITTKHEERDALEKVDDRLTSTVSTSFFLYTL